MLLLHWNNSHTGVRYNYFHFLEWQGTDLLVSVDVSHVSYGCKDEVCHLCVGDMEWLRCDRFTLFFCVFIWGRLNWYLLFLFWSRCPINIAWLLGKCFWTDYAVRPGHNWKYNYIIADIKVDCTNLKDYARRYLMISRKCFIWPTLLDFLVGSTWRFSPSLLIVKRKTPKYILVVSSSFQDTAYLTCYFNCLFTRYWLASCI